MASQLDGIDYTEGKEGKSPVTKQIKQKTG